MLRCKSVESFGRSQYTTFWTLLLIVEIPFDIQSREKNIIRNEQRTFSFPNDMFSKKLVSRIPDACYNSKTLTSFHFGRCNGDKNEQYSR